MNSRFLKVQLTNESSVLSIDTDIFVTINAQRIDGKSGTFEGVVDETGKIEIELNGWMLELPGLVKCDISLVKNDYRLTSFNFYIDVTPCSGSSAQITQSDNYDILTSLIENADQLNRDFEQAITELSNTINHSSQATEQALRAAENANRAAENVTNGTNQSTNPYPIGSVYLSETSNNPTALFGGYWENMVEKGFSFGVDDWGNEIRLFLYKHTTEPSVIETGFCGLNEDDVYTVSDNVRYSLYDDGTLVISGFGKMFNHIQKPATDRPAWQNHASNIKRVIIEEGVLSIGSYSFCQCKNLYTISMPNSLIGVYEGNLDQCAISELVIPDSVETIGMNVFASCYSLKSITIGSNVNYIDSMSFTNLTSLQSIYLKPTTPPVLRADVFRDMNENAVIYIPSGTLSNYQTASGWSGFADKMIEIVYE